jgi:hypothetical protein
MAHWRDGLRMRRDANARRGRRVEVVGFLEIDQVVGAIIRLGSGISSLYFYPCSPIVFILLS